MSTGIPRVVRRVTQVTCFAQHSGTSRRGSTEYECTIFLANARVNRLERTCAVNQNGRAPSLRLISSSPGIYAVSWGPGELLGRFVFVLGFPVVLILACGFACF